MCVRGQKKIALHGPRDRKDVAFMFHVGATCDQVA